MFMAIFSYNQSHSCSHSEPLRDCREVYSSPPENGHKTRSCPIKKSKRDTKMQLNSTKNENIKTIQAQQMTENDSTQSGTAESGWGLRVISPPLQPVVSLKEKFTFS